MGGTDRPIGTDGVGTVAWCAEDLRDDGGSVAKAGCLYGYDAEQPRGRNCADDS